MSSDQRRTVLVVDDSPMDIAFLSELLREEYTVLCATNADRALEILRSSGSVDLMLLDIMMQGLDGLESCRRLQADPATRRMPVIFVTSRNADEDEAAGFEAGCVDYVMKPVNPHLLRARVRTHIERERLRTRLLKARELESVALLAAGVAHDFNNILAGISGYAEVLKLKLTEGSLREQAQRILEAAKRGGYVVHGLLAFSDQQRAASEPIDLNRLLLGEREELQRSLGPSVALHLELSHAELRIRGDAEQLCEVLRHLAENSKDAMPNGGSFTIQTDAREPAVELVGADGKAARGPFACLTVSDTGIGMDEEMQKRLFEPFFTTKQFGTSAGIGLAAIYGIVRQHDGFID
ncbi:MAG: response regulator, partial [Spirochaetes bacterium]|nr:response regulator [Spirochaetota bacterium]